MSEIPGILPSQEMDAAIASGVISADLAIPDGQVQPASIDLRLSNTAYRVRASFLPGANATVADKLKNFTMHKIDLTDGAVLEKGCVYIVPLQESLKLPADTSGMANPKSSTGRLDIFTRVITDGAAEFDRIEAGYSGPLYAEISPLTFSVLVHPGSRLSQLRLRRGEFEVADGVAFTVDLTGFEVDDQAKKIVGYKAKQHAGVVDVENIGHYDVLDYWDPIIARADKALVLDPDEFYILASKEAVSVPPDQAAEMRAYDTLVGEFRVHYAGFFDPGFGHDAAGGSGSRAVLEVRSHDVPFVIEDGQMVGRLVYEPLTATPDILYGLDVGSNYQSQGLKLSKHFK
ncbi:MAG: 2'-deoxycytidine 5'-triphosphate deaminase [Rhodospirillaceae bacterium]|jgi:dCTP deaminase|nr:2'-deoxycytidine 5'-triphosphate deaminase [Rhodospirillaceae bacterium]MBT4588350.1 2'-deoxycytidine 5'-triphosphate deaminase [Rhodospirillaceae bacterium]MBT4940194.1 2'-deoxycytidine 5'-triphosphate deaminase [Rhodospirillaceae bacterium]MBT7266055.1 2'-deoxycytidine 5'-triphosphate deaminase [Rhodospirillaceae bacterium]